MTAYYVEQSFTVAGAPRPETLEEHLDCVADNLVDLSDVSDADLGANLAAGRVDFMMTVEAEDGPGALAKSLVAIRTAIHACEGCTPGWESHFKELQQTTRPADLVDA